VRVRFDEFTLDSEAMELQRGTRELHLSKKAFDLLRILISKRDRVVGKAELHAELWPDTFVVDTNLNVLVAEIRKVLSDSARDPRLLKTVHGVGYRFSGEVEDVAVGPRSTKARYWLVVNDRKYALSNGETIIGRDPACDVWLDVPGVSRRHARIHTSPTGDVILEDSSSTNGTYLGKSRITGPTRLRDGDQIHIGSLVLTFRTSGGSKETERVHPREQRS
jgi:DNA-binding winged helix-turn-helix (wHTH) protein